MIFTIPILTAVMLFLLWALVKLTLNALPLFVGMSVSFYAFANGHGGVAALVVGCLTALIVVLLGEWAFAHARSIVKLLVAMMFAVPAAVAAYHTVRGFAVLMMPGHMDITGLASGVAIFIGWMAWARIAKNGQRRFAGVARDRSAPPRVPTLSQRAKRNTGRIRSHYRAREAEHRPDPELRHPDRIADLLATPRLPTTSFSNRQAPLNDLVHG